MASWPPATGPQSLQPYAQVTHDSLDILWLCLGTECINLREGRLKSQIAPEKGTTWLNSTSSKYRSVTKPGITPGTTLLGLLPTLRSSCQGAAHAVLRNKFTAGYVRAAFLPYGLGLVNTRLRDLPGGIAPPPIYLHTDYVRTF